MKNNALVFLSILLALFLFSLFSNDGDHIQDTHRESGINYSNYNTSPKGERLLGIDITMPKDNDYDSAFELGKELGMDFTTLSISWDDIEKSQKQYENENLKIANYYYPLKNTKLVLILNPIDTTVNRMPEYLQSKSFNDPEVIRQFKQLIDYTLSQIQDIELVSISIGNEIDFYLGNDTENWQEYEDFFKEIKTYIKKKSPSLKIGTKISFTGLTVNNIEESKSINKYSDVVMVTYYPLNADFTVKDTSVVSKDFNVLSEMYEKEIQFLETGYPSGKLVKSSELKQAEFFHELFISWDKHKDKIKVLTLNWLHDISSDELGIFEEYYGINDKKFVDYLGSLGFIRYDSKEKQSFSIIKKETEVRNW
jgi:hypothetical protein